MEMNEMHKEYNLCLNENGEKENTSEDDLCIRCLRKKYKCLIIWLLSITSLSQLLYLILEKVDNNLLEKMLKNILYKNLTNLP